MENLIRMLMGLLLKSRITANCSFSIMAMMQSVGEVSFINSPDLLCLSQSNSEINPACTVLLCLVSKQKEIDSQGEAAIGFGCSFRLHTFCQGQKLDRGTRPRSKERLHVFQDSQHEDLHLNLGICGKGETAKH